ncbi:MAG TPA: Uma2 family endonuclease [Cyclobacteriaceae bacterium]|jgi:Uma2 family endonuclease|nr:Uma2 family endonuclease [Cyclobacteriaceae bacterium]
MNPVVIKQKATSKDYLNLPEGAPYQLINGELIMSPSPVSLHQRVLLKLVEELGAIIKKSNSGELFISPLDVYFDDENIFQPDIFFIAKDNPAQTDDHDWVRGIPDLIIEILSPSNAYYDTQKKMRVYEKYGVQEYFIVDPEDKMVTAYSIIEEKYKEQYREEGKIKSSLLHMEFQF